MYRVDRNKEKKSLMEFFVSVILLVECAIILNGILLKRVNVIHPNHYH